MRKLVKVYAKEFIDQFASTVLPFVEKLANQGYFPELYFSYTGIVPKKQVSEDDMYDFQYEFEEEIGDIENVDSKFESYDEKNWVFELSASHSLLPYTGKAAKIPTERKMGTLRELADEYESDISFLTLFFYDNEGNRLARYFCPEDSWEIW
ncbi:MAG: hypothetical protein U9N14_06180 [Pseudomonadota bacterium]|nr:hypothetical protein [Pseudomonadota bacterium]